jgi:glyoxylase-like metal-dependent hydrolase (beta-lactamase superfamily II)
MVAFSTSPPHGLNGTGWLLLHPDGNTAFEAAPFYTDEMLDEIRRLGGIRFLASSHVHGYGALWQLQDVFEPEVLAIQKEDLRLTKAFRVTWPYDEALELMPGLTLMHVGGHYEGQAVLHDARRKILFCGDAFKVDQDEAGNSLAVSTHKAFHKVDPADAGRDPALPRGHRAARLRHGLHALRARARRRTATSRSPVLDDQLRGPPGVRHLPMEQLRKGGA